MKKIYCMIFGVALLTACSGKQKDMPVDTDTIFTENPADELTAEMPILYLTKDSVGAISIGMPVSDVPSSIEGIYSEVKNGESEDAVTLEFYDGDRPLFVAYDFGEGKIDMINVIGMDVRVRTPKGELALGHKMEEVLDLAGVKAEWSGADDWGMWYWRWNGLWFAPDQENMSQVLSQRLYHSGQAPTIKDFQDEGTTIGFIGTGLPF